MRILVTGANSYLGARLFQDLKKEHQVIGTYNKNRLFSDLLKLDITDAAQIANIVREVRPEIILHVAAISNLKLCLQDPERARITNVVSVEIFSKLAREIGAKIVFISTIYAKKPEGLYAQTKQEAEAILRNGEVQYLIIRPDFILGSSPNITNDRQQNRLIKNIIDKTPAVYSADVMQVTWIRQVLQVISECIKRDIWNETLEVVSPEKKSRFEISKDILDNFGITCTLAEGPKTEREIYGDTSDLKRLNLPVYSYEQALNFIIEELKVQVSQLNKKNQKR